MRVLIIGHSVLDHIHLKNEEKISPGGIFYSTMGLRSFLPETDELFLLTNLDKRNEKYFSFLYDKLNVNYIRYVDAIPVVHLKHFDNEERCEWYENVTGKLDISILQNLNNFNGILINMITGFDISADDLSELRKQYNGLIYLDIHTLARGLGENNKREFRLIPGINTWLSNVDIVQVNESELLTLDKSACEAEIVNNVMEYGVRVLIITAAEQGGRIYFFENDKIKKFIYSAEKTKCINKVGCGDIFGSVFFYNYIAGKDIPMAVKSANLAAACVTEYENIKDFENLKRDTIKRLN